MDQVTFLSQFFWLTLIFLTLYIYTLKNILPQISKILKARRKKLQGNQDQLQDLKQEERSIIEGHDSTFANSLETSRNLLTKTVQTSLSWFETSLKNTNETIFLPTNQKFIKTIAQMNLTTFLMFRK